MSEKILVPVLGESISEATVAKWLKQEGDNVEADEPLVELETDKVNLEVPSPMDGLLSKINAKDGQVVKVGSVLGLVSQNGKEEIKKETPQNDQSSKKKMEEKLPPDTEKIIDEAENTIHENLKVDAELETKFFQDNDNIKVAKKEISNNEEEQPLILSNEIKAERKVSKAKSEQNLSPAVRKYVTEKKINTDEISGSGKDGRILKGDLINLMEVVPKPSQRKIKYGQEERIKMTRLRMTIAKRLKQAQENAAMLTTFNEIDMSSIIEMRKSHQEDFQKKFGVKLGFMSFFVKASIVGLKSFPIINAEIDNEDIVYKNYYNIGFAVGTEKGLVVPVLKNADELSFADIEKNIKDISQKSKDGKLNIEDLQGGTFTISNGGVYGSMLSTPILNPPQSAVLGMHNIVERSVVVKNEIKVRPVMYLALSYDHRIIDGKDSVSFLKCIKENLEDPRRLFLDL